MSLENLSQTLESVDGGALRSLVQEKYAEVAENPTATFHFHTGRPLAERLGYGDLIDRVPDSATAAFAGIANPILAGPLEEGMNVLDIGSGGGFDSIIAAQLVGPTGQVVGVDMTPLMLERARDAAAEAGLTNIEFIEGLAEELPLPDDWADIIISNGVLNLISDKALGFSEINRVLKTGGVLQFADIANGNPVPESAKSNIDLWAA